ncbi:MAG: aminotransferase [Deltaproteobacteria bacterium HGW-Deltaproteobacteria-14]|jgi:isopenicillin-N epimerase|nr:MAG: aminotransferase [Deltaproteobacteria bacterium HGW-Deltaproteobacteria-14]
MTSSLRALWPLDPDAAFLNHGSFGACPAAVLEQQAALRARIERQPVDFFVRQLPALLDGAREVLAGFLGADAAGLAFVPNATAGVNTVLASLALAPGDEIVVTDHGYRACTNAALHFAGRAGASVKVARFPFPGATPDAVVAAVLAAVGPRTRLVLIDHVTSQTGLVLPVERLVGALAERGVDTLIDGAHAAGMVPLDLGALGAAYYAGNCHKWLCTPKGSGYLHVREDRRAGLHPLIISHGWSLPEGRQTRFRLEFDWTGTGDPTPYLAVPFAIHYLAGLVAGGWDAIRARNRALALEMRATLMAALGIDTPPASDDMIGALVSLPVSDGDEAELNEALWRDHRVEVAVMAWPSPPRRLIRVAAQLYNGSRDVERLVAGLAALA